LYRLKNYDEFFNIAGEDIFDDENNIILVEWPEIIEKYYKATIKINILKT
jgi:tRNA A37 threonylcarbamoyladenosine biosynthesis protein TsaE